MRITLDAKDIPGKWYNIIPDLDFDVPPLMSSSGYPLSYHDLEPLAPSAIIDQELEREKRDIPIPKEIQAFYSEWRPTPLYRAERLEKSLETPARIFYKYEGYSPSGSHEMNTAVVQAYYAAQEESIKRIVTATGNGEWGASLAIACSYFGIQCQIYMVRSSYEEKPYGRYVMEVLGAEVIPSPSQKTRTGKKILEQTPDSPGSLSIALSEAFEEAITRDDIKFSWGTVMNHVLLHQTVIGLETRSQMRSAGASPDFIISAVGGGSGLGGLAFPFYQECKQRGTKIIAVETAAAPSLSKGRYAYDYGDTEGLFPLLKMYTLGHSFVPPGIRAGGMRYHGISPLVSALYREDQIEARTYAQSKAFEAAITFARTEGLIPSPEASYAVAAVIDEALACKQNKERKNILFLLDGNSNLDLTVFKDFVEGAIEDQPFPGERVQAALEKLPKVAQP
jgi:tryptophan synthase beta chain